MAILHLEASTASIVVWHQTCSLMKLREMDLPQVRNEKFQKNTSSESGKQLYSVADMILE